MHIIDAMGTCTMANAMLEYTAFYSIRMDVLRIISIDLGGMICADTTMGGGQVYHRRRPTAREVSRLGIRTFRAKKRARGIAGRSIHEVFGHLNELNRWG